MMRDERTERIMYQVNFVETRMEAFVEESQEILMGIYSQMETPITEDYHRRIPIYNSRGNFNI